MDCAQRFRNVLEAEMAYLNALKAKKQSMTNEKSMLDHVCTSDVSATNDKHFNINFAKAIPLQQTIPGWNGLGHVHSLSRAMDCDSHLQGLEDHSRQDDVSASKAVFPGIPSVCLVDKCSIRHYEQSLCSTVHDNVQTGASFPLSSTLPIATSSPGWEDSLQCESMAEQFHGDEMCRNVESRRCTSKLLRQRPPAELNAFPGASTDCDTSNQVCCLLPRSVVAV